MNYIKEAENILFYYNDLYRSIQNLDREIGKLVAKQGPKVLTAVSGDETGIRGSSKQEEAENAMFRLQILTGNRLKTEEELQKIDKILDEFSRDPGCKHYGQVLTEWYIFRTPKEEIAGQIGYSSKQSIYDLKNRAIRKFAVQYFGIEALRTM